MHEIVLPNSLFKTSNKYESHRLPFTMIVFNNVHINAELNTSEHKKTIDKKYKS